MTCVCTRSCLRHPMHRLNGAHSCFFSGTERGERLLPESLWKHSSQVRAVGGSEALSTASSSFFLPLCIEGSFGCVTLSGRQLSSAGEHQGGKPGDKLPIDLLTMKPVFVLLVSMAWTLAGAQYYYQGLMDYLENRLLAIEVKSNPFLYEWASVLVFQDSLLLLFELNYHAN